MRRNTARGRMERADHALAMEIAREEFEKRERAKREYRENEARKHGIEVPRDSRGVEIRRISTPIEFGPYPGLGSSEGDFRSETVGERKRREALEEEESWEFNALSLGDTPRPQPYQTDNTVDIIDPYDFGGFLELQNDRIREEPKAGRWTGSYPTIPKSRHSTSSSSFISSPTPPRPPKSQYAPAPPPKIPDINIRYRVPDRSEIPVILPPKPPKFVPSEEEEEAGRPFSATASLENGQPLRTLFLPASLRKTFLSIARPNTHANLETCGLLCGSLIRNALFVSRLVIPEQEATSDTCATKDEMGLFDYCDKEDLMVFGWIHTHPTQTCFMSSVDLHTHASYQLMLNESIAVVCAPSKNPS